MDLEVYTKIISHLFKFFDDDYDTVVRWLETKNPLLGGHKPMDYVAVGREQQLLEFITVQLDTNKSPYDA